MRAQAVATVSATLLVAALLAGCPAPPRRSPSEAPPPLAGISRAHQGRPYDVVTGESLLTIVAFRGGALSKAGHNHVIAARDLTGTIYVPDDAAHSTFEIHVPVGELTVDEPQLRMQAGADFPPDVPDSAKEGTRHNMLSEALLDGAQYPEITLVAQSVTSAAGWAVPSPPAGSAPAADAQVSVQVTVRAQTHTIAVPVHYEIAAGQLVASGEFPLKQTDLGLTPFSAFLGALQVQDELRVKFRIVARAAH